MLKFAHLFNILGFSFLSQRLHWGFGPTGGPPFLVFQLNLYYLNVCLETRGHLSDDDITALELVPDYVATVKKRLSEVCSSECVMDSVSVSALDRLSCLADVCCL